MVIEGRMVLRIEGKKRIYEKGDECLISAQAMHRASCLERNSVMDFFSEKTGMHKNNRSFAFLK